MDRGDHGDVNVTRLAAEELRRFLLAAGGDRIDVEEERFSGEMRLDRLGRIHAGRSSYRRHDGVGTAYGVRGGGCAAHTDRGGGTFELCALGMRKQDVPGGDALDARIAQARGNRLARFAKADETQCRLSVRHRRSLMASVTR